MTKDDLPPLPAVPLPNGFPVEQHGVIAKFAQDYALAAIAAHDAKRPRVRIWRHGEGSAWHTSEANPALFPSIEYAWAYIELEGA